MDPRLVHATITNVWVPTTGAQTLVVADKKVYDNPRRRVILEMSAMDGPKVVFTTEERLARALHEEVDPKQPAIVLFSTLEGVERALKAQPELEIRRLIIGHIPEAPGREPLHPAVHLGPADLDVVSRLQERGADVQIQPLPQDKAIALPKKRPETKPAEPLPKSRVEARLEVVNTRGLHLRAAHLLAHLAGRLPCDVQVGCEGAWVNAKSLLGLTTLGATCGTVLDVLADGPGAEAAMVQIKELFSSGFGEGAERPPAGKKRGDRS